MIAGADEAGRGCVLADLVLTIALIDDKNTLENLGLKDSKLLAPKKREELDKIIRKKCKIYSYTITAEELNQLMNKHSLNEIEAIKIAHLINKIYEDGYKINILYVDSPDHIASNFSKRINRRLKKELIDKINIISEHKADYKYPIVSAASIVSKVMRDAEIERIKQEVGYDFNSGYTSDKITIKFLEECHKDPKVKKYIREHWETYKRIKESAIQSSLGEF
ncbi:ribonuclease HII [Candidatus Micrarchaeota archaeon]|jgi:ribonuclease HII|nr:ribonuclease HII [Candidatus Micrarchaeota archaeon]